MKIRQRVSVGVCVAALGSIAPVAARQAASADQDVYSDFDVQLAASTPVVQENRGANGRYRISRNRSIVGAINGRGPEFELRTFNSNVYVRKGR